MSNATTARATLSVHARSILARTVSAKGGRYSHGVNLSTAESIERTGAAMRELEQHGLVTATLIPCEDAEDPWYTLVATDRGLRSYAKAQAAGLAA